MKCCLKTFMYAINPFFPDALKRKLSKFDGCITLTFWKLILTEENCRLALRLIMCPQPKGNGGHIVFVVDPVGIGVCIGVACLRCI